MSMAEAQLLRAAIARIDTLEARIEGEPLIKRVQQLELRVGGLQGQINALRMKGPTPAIADPDADKADAATG